MGSDGSAMAMGGIRTKRMVQAAEDLLSCLSKIIRRPQSIYISDAAANVYFVEM